MLDLYAFTLLADEAARPSSPLPFDLLLPVGIAFVFYLLVWRPMRRQEKERQGLLTSLKKNDKVLTTAGIYGTVVSVSDKEDEVVVKVDDNTRLRMLKGSIMRNLSNEEAQKAEKEKK